MCKICGDLYSICRNIGIENYKNKNINGIMVDNCDSEFILSQYADDVSLFLENENSIFQSLETIQEFSSVAGPKLYMQTRNCLMQKAG